MNRETKDSERGVAKTVFIEAPSEKQKEFLRASTKHVGFGGASDAKVFAAWIEACEKLASL